MKTRFSPAMIGGCMGIAYFLLTLGAAYLFGGDEKGAMVITQLTNLHVTALFIFLDSVLPLHLVSQWMFQLLIGIAANFALGSAIGAGIGGVWRRA